MKDQLKINNKDLKKKPAKKIIYIYALKKKEKEKRKDDRNKR